MTLEIALKPLVVLELGFAGSRRLVVGCAGFVGKFMINTIPTMSVAVAADAINMRTSAPVSSTDFTVFNESTPATLWYRVSFPDTRVEYWVKLFSGEFAGVDIERGSKTASYTISLRHDLAYLSYVSAISATNHPGNPIDYTFPAVSKFQGSSSGTSTRTWATAIDKGLVTASNLDDLWTNVLQKWLLALAQDDPFDKSLLNAAFLQLNTILRVKVLRAIQITTIAPNTPLTLDTTASGDPIRSNISASLLGFGTDGDFVQTTMWGKLLSEWAPEYLFDILPRCEGAWVAPATGALNSTVFPHVAIGYDEITDVNLHTPLDQELQAVILTHPPANLTGANGTNVPDASSKSGAFGLFKPTDLKSGIILIKQAPAWLSRCDTTSARLSETAPPEQTCTAVDETVGPPPEDGPQTVAENSLKGVKTMVDKYAEQIYINERLKGRMAQITGILRFDITPGTHVTFTSTHSDIAYAGRVVEVSIIMNAESRAVGTTFLLSHVRTLVEDIQLGFSMKETIVYPKLFTSGSLVDIASPPADVIALANSLEE